MADNYRIDGHKLLFHVQRVNAWLAGRTVCPIYLEIAPSGGCNYRCIFCAVDYLDYKPVFLDAKVLKTTVKQAAACGVKSVMYAGEGEPLLHQEIAGICAFTRGCGIDVAITTNGLLCSKEMSLEILKFLSWIRVSLNAGKSSTYELVHKTLAENFYKVLGNLEEAVRIKKRYKLKTAIGVQLLLIPQNVSEVFLLAKILKKIGVDYFTIKPYSQHPLSGSHIDAQFKYEEYLHMNKKLQKIEDKKFKIIFRGRTMQRLNEAKEYAHCFGLPFWAYIDAHGDVYACSAFLGKKEFCFGNIYKNNFKAILNSKKRKIILERAASKLDMSVCRQACRMDKINSYLWELKNPGEHVNFI